MDNFNQKARRLAKKEEFVLTKEFSEKQIDVGDGIYKFKDSANSDRFAMSCASVDLAHLGE